MSSTNKTANLELNQWTASDPVLMADFNADNAAIDAAVAKRLGRYLLSQASSTQANSDLSISLGDVDWSEWEYVEVDFTPAEGSSSSAPIYIHPNGSTSGCYYYQVGSSNQIDGHLGSFTGDTLTQRLRFKVYRQSGRHLLTRAEPGALPEQFGYCSGLTYSQLSSISFSYVSAGNKMAAGTRLAVYGIA